MRFWDVLGLVENESTNDAFTFYVSGNILVFRKLDKNKAKQAENLPCFGFGTICIIRGRVLVLVKLQTTLQSSLKLTYLHRCFYGLNRKNGPKLQNTLCAFLHFKETLSLDFLEMNFPKTVLVIIL